MSTRHDAVDVDPFPLGQPLHFAFSGMAAPNRFLKGAMSERLCTWSPTDITARGIPTDQLINLYRRWGEGGFGLLLSGNIMISSTQLEAAGNPIVPLNSPFSGERFEAFSKLATAAKKGGSLFIGQIGHPGRQVADAIEKYPISASDIQLQPAMGMRFAKPRPASKAELSEVVAGFVHTATYLEKAGFHGCQLHGAHGYLLAQFLSKSTNKRTDEFGGSLENRARLIIDIAHGIRRATRPDFILGIKMNSVEFQEDGFSADEAKDLARLLEASTFDFIELSGGTYESLGFEHKRESTLRREAFFLDFADEIVPQLSNTKAYVTGGFRTVGAMVGALKTVHGIGIGRPVTQEPYLPVDILRRKVNSSIKQRFDQNDFGMTSIVAGTQMLQLGQDHKPFDGSDAQQQMGFITDLRKWAKTKRDDHALHQYGYVHVESLPAVPFCSVPTML